MKAVWSRLAICTIALVMGPVALADTPLVWRGETILNLEELDARMLRFPHADRATYARDPANLARLMDQLLVNRVLAAEARELDLDQDPKVIQDLSLAIEEVLAIHRLNHLLDPKNYPDFEMLAYERYLSDSSVREVAAGQVVQHILVSLEGRGDEEALAEAVRLRQEAQAHPDRFDNLVTQHSDDPGKSSNNGIYRIEDPEIYQPDFVSAARALQQIGDISEPVKTQFGYHVIKLLEVIPARTRPFEEVKAQLIKRERDQYVKSARTDYLRDIRSRDAEVGDEQLLLTLPARYGGRPEEAGIQEEQTAADKP